MALSPHTTPLFARFVAFAVAAAAIAVPAAQASNSPSGLISENSASQNRIAAAQRGYGPPDPWMYPFMHNGALINRRSASSAGYGLITENSASQNRLDRISTQQDRLISENSASQNRIAAAQRGYGPPDPWMYPFMHNGALISRSSASSAGYGLITENSASQNRLAQTALKPTAVASAPTNGFDWLDAALGSTLALTVLAAGATIAVRRMRTGVAAGH